MKDRELTAASPLEGESLQVTPIDSSSLDAVSTTGTLAQPSKPQFTLIDPREQKRIRIRRGILCTCAALLIVGGVFILLHPRPPASELHSGNFATVSIPLNKISANTQNLNDASSLKVNGQLNVANSLVLAPSTPPTKPTEGQLFYDKASSRLSYFDGKEFLFLQGGGNTFVTNNIAGNTTNVNNITNVLGGGINATGSTAGAIAMFTNTDTLGSSIISQAGSNLTLGTNSGSGSTLLQSGTGGISLQTGNQSGVSGNIKISTGDSSTTASGDITIDTGSGILNGVLVGQKTFESGIDNMFPWYGTTLAASTEQARTGLQSLKMTKTGNFWGILENNGFAGTPATPGHKYYVSAWVRAATTSDTFSLVVLWHNGVVSSTMLNAVTDNTTGWSEISGIVTAPAGTDMIYLQSSGTSGSPGEVHYWDDITITDLSSSSSASTINIGTTNAKIVNLGNINQIGPTSIAGGGINLNAGVSDLNMTAGVFSMTGAAASQLSTSAGALSITSGSAATWGVAAADSGTGGDLTLHAGDGAWGSDGGNLVLQGGLGADTGIGGAVIVRPREDSAVAFQIQNSTGNTPLFTADTSSMSLIVSGTATTFAKLKFINAHFDSTQTIAPTVTVPTNCGVTPAAAVTAASTDNAGSFTITTGSGGTSSTCDTTITFNAAFGAIPKSIIVIGKTDAASAQRQIYVSAATATSFTVSFATSAGGANGTPYSFSYWIVE